MVGYKICLDSSLVYERQKFISLNYHVIARNGFDRGWGNNAEIVLSMMVLGLETTAIPGYYVGGFWLGDNIDERLVFCMLLRTVYRQKSLAKFVVLDFQTTNYS